MDNKTNHHQQQLGQAITAAQLQWNSQGDPSSTVFDDCYYSASDGLQESRYVFLQHNQLPERWQQLTDQPETSFTIAETGFGTGLNFLATCHAWQQQSLQQAQLHYVSIEKFPLSAADLEKTLDRWPELEPFAKCLAQQYPALIQGFHRIELPQYRIHLTLIFADVNAALSQLEASIDAWFLDGFAPGKNPQMWQPALFQAMARLSHSATSVATFTAAGIVKRGLISAGFNVHKPAGFGHKRDMLAGTQHTAMQPATEAHYRQTPWFISKHRYSKPEHAVVIGAGLAGTAVSYALAKRGCAVTVIEQEQQIAQHASGNPSGVTFTRLSPFNTPQNRFYQQAYLYAVRQLEQRLTGSNLVEFTDYALNGVLRFAFNQQEAQAQQALANSGLWPESLATTVDAAQASELLGFACPFGGLLLRKGGWLTPADLCHLNMQAEGIKLITRHRVTDFRYLEDQRQWQLECQASTPAAALNLSADAIIFANSFGAAQMPGFDWLPLRAVRGQISYVPATAQSKNLKLALNYNGYITPAKEGWHAVGASFQSNQTNLDFYARDHQENLQHLRDCIPALAENLLAQQPTPSAWPIQQGRVALRCQSPDYLPIIGPLPDRSAFMEDYQLLRKGMHKIAYPTATYLPRVFASLAHGSRGITSSLLAAEVIASQLFHQPLPVDSEVLAATHPARFLIRALKRNQL